MSEVVNYYIGNGVNDNYATIQDWWNDFIHQGSGDLVSQDVQVNAYLRGAQAHPVVTGIPPQLTNPFFEARSHFLLMGTSPDINTDASHYFNIAAESGYEFYGTFDDPNVPYITCSGNDGFTSKGGIYCDIPYTQFNGFIIKDINHTLQGNTGGFFALPNSVFGLFLFNKSGVADRIGVQNIVSSQRNTQGTRAYGIYALDDATTRNCVVNNIFGTSTSGFSQTIGIAARYDARIFNNTVSNISGTFTSPTGFVIGIGYPTFNGKTIPPPDEGINLASPEVWFDASVGPLYSGSSLANLQPTTTVDAVVRRWNSLVNNYSGLPTSLSVAHSWYIDNDLSPKGLRPVSAADLVGNPANHILHTQNINGGWTKGHTIAAVFSILKPNLSTGFESPLISGTIISNPRINNNGVNQFRIVDLTYSFNNITGTLYSKIQLGTSFTQTVSVSPVFTGVWYSATVTADPFNMLLADEPKLYMEVSTVGSGSASLAGASDFWSLYTSAPTGLRDIISLNGASRSTLSQIENVAVTQLGEALIYTTPLPEIQPNTAGRKDIRSYLYDKWVETTGVSFIAPTIPSGVWYVNNYVGTVAGTAQHAIVCMGTGLGPVPSSNAVSDTSLIVSNGNLISINPTDAILSNNRFSFNPSLLVTSPLLDVGVDLSDFGFNTDVGGELRTVWDIGADERFSYTSNNNIPLSMYGHENSDNNTPLSISGSNTPSASITLAIPYIFPVSSLFNLFLKHSGIPTSNTRTLYMKAITGKETGGLNLIMSGFGYGVNNSIGLFLEQDTNPSGMNLFIGGNSLYAPHTGNTPMFIYGYNTNGGLNLSMSGFGYGISNSIGLFLGQYANPSGMNLFIEGFSAIDTGNIPMFIYGDGINTSMNLYMSGYGYGQDSNITFSLLGNSVSDANLPLYISGFHDYRKLNLYIAGENSVKLQNSIPLYINGDMAHNLNLYLKAPSSGDYTDHLNLLLLGGGTDSQNTVSLHLHNTQAGTSGWGVDQEGMNLYIARDSEGTDNRIPLTLFGHISSNSGINMFLQSNLTGVGNIGLYIDGLPAAGSTVPIYVRGF